MARARPHDPAAACYLATVRIAQSLPGTRQRCADLERVLEALAGALEPPRRDAATPQAIQRNAAPDRNRACAS